jgi:prevent-host-death family protein
MDRTINAKELRASLPKIVERVRRGERFTVIYRSRPALRLVPVSDDALAAVPLENDPLYRAEAVGASSDGLGSEDHDQVLYRR